MKLRVLPIVAAAIFSAARAGAEPPLCNTAATTPPSPANSHAASNYPILSMVLHEEGTTAVTFVIGTDGKTSASAVAQSSGSLRLDDASKEAVQSWVYNPATSGGKLIACLQRAQVKWLIPDETQPSKKDQ